MAAGAGTEIGLNLSFEAINGILAPCDDAGVIEALDNPNNRNKFKVLNLGEVILEMSIKGAENTSDGRHRFYEISAFSGTDDIVHKSPGLIWMGPEGGNPAIARIVATQLDTIYHITAVSGAGGNVSPRADQTRLYATLTGNV